MKIILISIVLFDILWSFYMTALFSNFSKRKFEVIDETYESGINNALIKDNDIKKIIIRGNGGEITLTNGTFFDCTDIEYIIRTGKDMLLFPSIKDGDLICSYKNYSTRKVLKEIK